MNPLQLKFATDEYTAAVELARLRASGKHKLAATAERLWAALRHRGEWLRAVSTGDERG
jgi:hypothetical protein